MIIYIKTLELIEARLEYDGEKYEDTIQSLKNERDVIYDEYIHCIIVDFYMERMDRG
jgi:hypothetical protein